MQAAPLLEDVEDKAGAFFDSCEVQGRQQIMKTLSIKLSEDKGIFLLLLGGTDVGTTFILSSLEQQLNDGDKNMVVTLSGRLDGANFHLALFKALMIYMCKYRVDMSALRGSLASTVKRVYESHWFQERLPVEEAALPAEKVTAREQVSRSNQFDRLGCIIDSELTPAERAELTLDSLLSLYATINEIRWKGTRKPVIIVDHVHRMLRDSPPERAEAARNVLDRLQLDTKGKQHFGCAGMLPTI
jgi:hypothetical protein